MIVNVSKHHSTADNVTYAALPENHLEMENVSLVRVLDLEGGYVTIKARMAYFDHNTDLLSMTDTEFNMIKSGTHLTSHADRGIYQLNEKLVTKGNVYGTWNDLRYKVDEQGTLVYDFNKDMASVGDNVTLTKNNSRIFAKKLDYDGAKQLTVFTGGVDMTIVEGDLQ